MTLLKTLLILPVRLLTVVFIILLILIVAGIMMWDAGNAKRNNNFGRQIRDGCLS